MNKILLALLASVSISSYASNPIINETFMKDEINLLESSPVNQKMLLKVNRIIDHENKKILDLRNKLLSIDIHKYKDSDVEFLKSLSEKFDVKYSTPSQSILKLLNRVDTVPNSMMLAHFVSHYNSGSFSNDKLNYFGKPCIDDSCLIDIETLSYMDKKYESVYDSVSEYIHNINTNNIFEKLREKRSLDRKNGNKFDSYQYSKFLSVFGGDYFIDSVNQSIDKYKLWQYDN